MKKNKVESPEKLESLRREKQYLIKINNKKSEGPKAFIKYIQNADYC